ncbi:MAG: hypothetical protein WKG00_18300 [Polyangiaceae bacterium]
MPIALGLWALLMSFVVRAGGDVAAVVGAAVFVAGSLAISVLASSGPPLRAAGALALLAPWFSLGAYGWMDAPLGGACFTCSPHFCGPDYSGGDGSVPLGWTLWVPIVVTGLLAAVFAGVGERALRGLGPRIRWLVLASAIWAVLSLSLLSVHAMRTATPEQYTSALPLVGTVVPGSASAEVSIDHGATPLGIETQAFSIGFTRVSVRRGDLSGTCGFEGADTGPIAVREDAALQALFFVPERGVAVACHAADLQCMPVSALGVMHRIRPSPAWFIWAVIGLIFAAALQAWRAARARTLEAPRLPAPVGVYREPEREENAARARTLEALLAVDGWTVAILVTSSAPVVSMLLTYLGGWPPR